MKSSSYNQPRLLDRKSNPDQKIEKLHNKNTSKKEFSLKNTLQE